MNGNHTVIIKNGLPEKESLAMKESPKEHIKRNSWAKGSPPLRLRSLIKAKKHNLPRRLTGGLRTILIPGAASCESHRSLNFVWHSSLSSSIVDTSVSLLYTGHFHIR
ncbi:hypothetical protein B9Z19DRAFT_1131039 [Tuber borchii]|uniref:Uncharacterized protein n=1 Tax=Tuber borchii TaxID=42251 RepID=A0A2T6ZJF6_TUBBO|nr:hypothetical protein B9Z19DRAFT_1131039 [Tuber borchii]